MTTYAKSYDIPILLATLMWFLSLFLLAFKLNNSPTLGWEAFFTGVLFGWFFLCFQAFSNFTFLIAIYRLKDTYNPYALAIFTFVLGASSFVIPIGFEAWGWGAILWISAYAIVMIVAFAREYPDKARNIEKWFIAIPIAWVMLFALGQYQYRVLELRVSNFSSWQVVFLNTFLD